MLPKILTQIFGSRNERLLKGYRQTVQKINALEPSFEGLSEDALRAKTVEFRERLAKGEALDALLPEAFATVREGSKRVLKMRHFDVQLLGGMTLNAGKIAEMRTGEGKTLMATLPVYLNAITGKGVHVVTVNDYLARRDAEWMGRLYTYLGLSVGVNVPGLSREEKQAAYQADVTYGTNNEFGFDYLRDNMVHEVADRVARGLSYAIVDEVDSILIDEARTPLIISGQAEDHTELMDSHWREHLASLDYLRQGIHLRGYAQKNPKQEYKREAFELFSQMLDVVKMEVTRILMTVRIQSQEQVAQAAQAIESQASHLSNVTYTHPNEDGSVSQETDPDTLAAQVPKVGRNDPCPCGSGKKYKLCHGRLS
ncbi:hypothetical protein B566_EDAN019273 [Ephemera danica]|nr:hypothetical protein B566_EDAN019273 [Ephemera danica]